MRSQVIFQLAIVIHFPVSNTTQWVTVSALYVWELYSSCLFGGLFCFVPHSTFQCFCFFFVINHFHHQFSKWSMSENLQLACFYMVLFTQSKQHNQNCINITWNTQLKLWLWNTTNGFTLDLKSTFDSVHIKECCSFCAVGVFLFASTCKNDQKQHKPQALPSLVCQPGSRMIMWCWCHGKPTCRTAESRACVVTWGYGHAAVRLPWLAWPMLIPQCIPGWQLSPRRSPSHAHVLDARWK